jgi:hypothetical protein
MLKVYLDGLSVFVHLRPVSCVSNQDEEKQEQTTHLDKLSTLDTQDTGRRQTRTDNPSR